MCLLGVSVWVSLEALRGVLGVSLWVFVGSLWGVFMGLFGGT